MTGTLVGTGFADELNTRDVSTLLSAPCIEILVGLEITSLLVSVTFSHNVMELVVSELASGSKSISRVQLAPGASGVPVVQRLEKAVPVCTNSKSGAAVVSTPFKIKFSLPLLVIWIEIGLTVPQENGSEDPSQPPIVLKKSRLLSSTK